MLRALQRPQHHIAATADPAPGLVPGALAPGAGRAAGTGALAGRCPQGRPAPRPRSPRRRSPQKNRTHVMLMSLPNALDV